jgi:hypothetical protein
MTNIRLAIFLIICSTSFVKAQNKELTFLKKNFPKFGLTVDLPEDWDFQYGSENVKNKIFKCNFKESNNKTHYNTVGVSISYDVLSKTIVVDSLFEMIKVQFKNQIVGRELINYKVNNIQGLPTLSLKYSTSINELSMTSVDVYFIQSNILFNLNFTAVSDKFQSYENILTRIIKSIQVRESDSEALSQQPSFKKIESVYVNTKYAFEIEFPRDMYYIEEYMQTAVLVNKANQDTSEWFSMSISVQEGYDKKMTLKEYNQFALDWMKKGMLLANPDEAIKSVSFTHPHFSASKTSFNSIVNNRIRVVFIYATINSGKGYLFITISDKEHLKENEIQFDKVFKTMVLR